MNKGEDKRTILRGLLAALWHLLVIVLPLPAQEMGTLTEGRWLHRDLIESPHVYRLDLPPGHAYRVTVEQLGCDVFVFLRGLSGEQVFAVDSPTGKWGPERLFPAAGALYLLEIKPRDPPLAGQKSAYKVRLERLPGPIPKAELALAHAHARYFEKDWKGAFDQLLVALKVDKPLNLESKAGALLGMGNCSRRLSRPAQALDFYEQALKLWQELDIGVQCARTLNSMGSAYQALGNQRSALHRYEAALTLFLRHGDLSWQATICSNIGHIYDLLGEPERAREYYALSLKHFRQAGDGRREAWLLNNMGALFRRTGAWQDARNHFQRALRITRANGDRRWQARLLNSLGLLYLDLGQAEKALGFFEDALPIRREVSDKRGEAITLANLGTVRLHAGRPQEALTYYQEALQLQRTIGNRGGQAKSLYQIGSAELELGHQDKALTNYQQALVLFEAVENRRLTAITLSHMGVAYLAQGEEQAAADHLGRALSLQRRQHYPAGEIETLLSLARLARQTGRLMEARNYLEAAIKLVESQRTRIASTDLRVSWFAAVSACYEQLVDVLMAFHRDQPRAGYAIQALVISERARARGLQELLLESGTELRRGIDPELMKKRRNLLQQLSARSAAQLKLLDRKHKETAARAAEKGLQETLIALDELDTRIRLANPHHAELTSPHVLTVDEMKQLADTDTLLLVYDLGETASFLWVVTPDRIEAHQLPARAQIEAAARDYYGHLSLVNPGARAEQNRLAATLSKILLGPVAEQLQNHRLAIVADGALHYVPFAALPEPGGGPPLLQEHEVVMLPSLSVLALARRKPSSKDGLKKIAVLADPVFTAGDRRLQKPVAGARASSGTTRSGDEPFSFSRLPASRREARAIARLAGEDLCLLALDFDASRETALGGALRSYDVVHFATHGLLNDAHPELSAIVLSLYDKTGQACQGLLTLPDIFNLELDAELVVLSGCQTAWGKQVRGEGLVGLARGFLHAGAERMVASFWRVEDRATASLMERFYSSMLRQGKHPAAALRAAQLALRKERRYRDPWYWAAFSIHGDWR